MWPFTKQPPPIQEAKPVPKGFFSTDIAMQDFKNPIERYLLLQNSLKKTFQVPLALKDGNGTFAMDSKVLDTASTVTAQSAGLITDVQLNWFAGQGFIGYQIAALLAQNWLIDKACSMPAYDATRNGYEITINNGQEISPEILDYISRKDKEYKIIDNCVEIIRNCRIFGIRHALFMVDNPDPQYYEKPFNIDGVLPGSYKGISQIDPYWLAPMLDGQASSNPAAPDFYEPTWWMINGKKYHKSHFVIVKNGEVPDILKPTYLYGGVPVPQKIAERVYASEITANEAPKLAMSKRLTTLKLDLEAAITNSVSFTEKMNIWAQYQNNFGVKIIGGNEEISQYDTSLADLDTVIMTQYQIVAAGSDVPCTKLMGTTPKGFNSTGEHEEKSYHETLENIQQHWATPLLNRHHELLLRSHVIPKFKKDINNLVAVWNKTASLTALEVADINLKEAQTDQSLANSGAIDGVDIRNRLIADKESGYNGIEPIEEDLLPDLSDGEETNNADMNNENAIKDKA